MCIFLKEVLAFGVIYTYIFLKNWLLSVVSKVFGSNCFCVVFMAFVQSRLPLFV